MKDILKCRAKRWGNSIGILLPRSFVVEHNIKPREELVFEIKEKSSNVLSEMFGAGKDKKISKKEFLETRKLLESRF